MPLPVRTLIGSLFVGVASLLVLAPQYAKADPDPSVAGATETETSPAAIAHEGIEEIVVSARRRKETIQDTPIAITAVTTAQMEAMGNTKMSDIQGMVPNLLMTQQVTGGQALNMSLRGLSFADIEKSFDPTVAVVVDGAFIGTSTGQLLDFFDIASIEVLRGPQGTLFGRNTIGGVINVQRTRPADEYTGKFELEGGSYNTITGRGVFNAPLIKGLLDAKVFLFHTSTDGFLKYANTGQNGGGGDNTNFGASFLLTPSDAFNALLTLEKQTSTYDNAVSNISKTGEVFCAIVSPSQCNRNTTTDLDRKRGLDGTCAVWRRPKGCLPSTFRGNSGQRKYREVTRLRRRALFLRQQLHVEPTHRRRPLPGYGVSHRPVQFAGHHRHLDQRSRICRLQLAIRRPVAPELWRP